MSETAAVPVVEEGVKDGAAAKPSASKGYIKKYLFQSATTPEEDKEREEERKAHAKKSNPFSMRQFLFENFAQSISKTGEPSEKKQSKKKEAAEGEKKESKPIMTRIKEAFKSGEKTGSGEGEAAAAAAAEEPATASGEEKAE